MSDLPLIQHIRTLSVEIGARPLGSVNNLRAADYIHRTLSGFGLSTEHQFFDCPQWTCHAASLEVDGLPLTAEANDFSAAGDVTAECVAVGTLSELEAADLDGKIAVLYGDLAKGSGLPSQGAFYFPEREQRIADLLYRRHPAALISVHSRPGSCERLLRDWTYPFPSVTVPPETGLKLLHTAAKVRLAVDSTRQAAQASNVLAQHPGERPERLVFCAHFDSVAGSPGAIDNASGVALLLGLAERMSTRQWPLTLEFVAFNGEENGGVGDTEYLRQREKTLDSVVALVNVDGVGGTLGSNTLTMLGGSEDLQKLAQSVCTARPGMVWVEPWYESDHSAYAMRGVPALACTSSGVLNHHSPLDSIEWVSPAKLDEVLQAVLAFAEGAMAYTPATSRGE